MNQQNWRQSADSASPVTETVSQLRLRVLLDQVQERIAQIIDVPDRLDRLIEAMLAVTAGLDLDATLRSIVHSAIELFDAEYGALGIRDPHGDGSAAFIYEGIDDSTRVMIGDSPAAPESSDYSSNSARTLAIELHRRRGDHRSHRRRHPSRTDPAKRPGQPRRPSTTPRQHLHRRPSTRWWHHTVLVGPLPN